MDKFLVTGSSSGIGKATCQLLLSQQHHVIGIARRHAKFNPNNPGYLPLTLDLNNLVETEQQAKRLAQQHPRIRTLILCAGYGQFGELEQFSAAQMQKIMNVNFLSQAILIKHFLPQLKRQQQGRIIAIGSESALSGQRKGSLYCASKFALRGFLQSVRQECASHGISVTVINPGLVRTAFFDSLDFAPGDDHANAIATEQVVDCINTVINMRNNCVIEEINLQPMKKVVAKKKGQVTSPLK